MEGVDVHGGKGVVDWPRVRSAGVVFAWVKATEGMTFFDSRTEFNRREAAEAGLHVGLYHFARPDNNTPEEEAAHFVEVYEAAKPNELRPILDFEQPGEFNPRWALAWLRAVEAATGVRPILYTFSAHLSQMSQRAGFVELRDEYPDLWLANYGPNDGTRHPVSEPVGWNLVAHQYTSTGRVPGISGDVDRNFAPILAPILTEENMTAADVWTFLIPEVEGGPAKWTAQRHMRELRAKTTEMRAEINTLGTQGAANAAALARLEAAVAELQVDPIDMEALAEAVADKLAERMAS